MDRTDRIALAVIYPICLLLAFLIVPFIIAFALRFTGA